MNGRTGLVAIAVTRRGAETARRLAAALPELRVVVPQRFALPGEETHDGAGQAIAGAFETTGGLVLVMATGIAVRLLAPLLRDKREDPGVVVVDEGGRFAISLLAGHLGGANALAERVAAAIGAQPVITTASEMAGVPVPDLLARERGWAIAPESDLTRVAAALVNGDPVGMVQECGVGGWLPEPLPPHIAVYETLDELAWARPAAALIITHRAAPLPALPRCPYVLYRPRTLALGVGASSGAPANELLTLAGDALAAGRLARESVAVVATIDRKRDEPAVRALAEAFGVPLAAFPAAALAAVPGAWQRSETVLQAVGVGGVAEPAALLAAGEGAILAVPKIKSARATAAIACCARGNEVG
jgi:cobalamin biosynthesis protein CbiG